MMLQMEDSLVTSYITWAYNNSNVTSSNGHTSLSRIFASVLHGDQTVFSKEANKVSPKCSNQGTCVCREKKRGIFSGEELCLLLI